MPPSPPQGPSVLSFLLFLLLLLLLPFFCAAVPPHFPRGPSPASALAYARELLLRKLGFVCPTPDNASHVGRCRVCGITAAGPKHHVLIRIRRSKEGRPLVDSHKPWLTQAGFTASLPYRRLKQRAQGTAATA
eukprot:COSAG04_NODE_7418_length_1131_cov_6.780039_1_plen_132_part_10